MNMIQGYANLEVLTDTGYNSIAELPKNSKIMVFDNSSNVMFTKKYSVISEHYNGKAVSIDDYDFPLLATLATQLVWKDKVIKSREISKINKRDKISLINRFTYTCKKDLDNLTLIRLNMAYYATGYKYINWRYKYAIPGNWKCIVIRKHPERLRVLKSILNYLKIKYAIEINQSETGDWCVVYFNDTYELTKDMSPLNLSEVGSDMAIKLMDELLYWTGVNVSRDNTTYYIDTSHAGGIPKIIGLADMAGLHTIVDLSPDNICPSIKPSIYRISIMDTSSQLDLNSFDIKHRDYNGKIYNLVTDTGMAVCRVNNTTFIASTYKTKDFE